MAYITSLSFSLVLLNMLNMTKLILLKRMEFSWSIKISQFEMVNVENIKHFEKLNKTF